MFRGLRNTILILACAICVAGTQVFAGINSQKTTSSYEILQATETEYDFIFKQLTNTDSLETLYYNLNILSAYISTHTQLYFETANTVSDDTISVTLPSETLLIRYIYTAPEDYIETSTRLVSPLESTAIERFVFKNISSNERGGAILNSSEDQISVNSDFINNRTTENSGGAVFNSGKILLNGVFIKNHSTGTSVSGGAIQNTNELSLDADFVKNYTSGTNVSGGAVSNIAKNSDSDILDINGSFTGNYSLSTKQNSMGGAIYNYSDNSDYNANIINISASFISNYTNSTNGSAFGGAIYNGGLYSNITSITADFISNTSTAKASSLGGAIYNSSTIDSITGDFISNSSNSSTTTAIGGAICNSGTISTLNGMFLSNTSSGIGAQGGAIVNEGVLDIDEVSFIDNSAISKRNDALGGAIYNSGILRLKNEITFSGNYTSSQNNNSQGGAIYNIGSIEGPINGEFNENYAKSNSGNSFGGALFNAGYIETINANFTGSYAIGSSSYGGAIYNTNEIIELKSDFYQNNVSSTILSQGGAIFNKGSLLSINSEFKQNFVNSAKLAQGGAIYNTGDIFAFNSNDKITNFSDNYATSSNTAEAGALYNEGAIFELSQVDFANNYTKANKDALGGAIFNKGYISGIKENSFNDNYAEALNGVASGGAIYNNGTINEFYTTLKNNYTNGNQSSGGALYNDGLIIEITSTFEENYARALNGDAFGGAIYHSGTMTSGILNSSFINNYALSTNGNAYGGAIYLTNDLLIRADNGQTIFQGNYVQSGSNKVSEAIYVGDKSKTLTLDTTNNGEILFHDNINGELGYNINITGDDTSSITFNAKVYNGVITLNDTYLYFNETTFEQTNSELVTMSGFIDLVDREMKNYTISNLTSYEEATYSIDIDPLTQTADTFTIENNAKGVVTIDTLNYLNEITQDVFIKILHTDSADIELKLTDEVIDWATQIPNTVYNTDVFIQETGAAVIDKHTLKLLYGRELDTLQLINEKVTKEGEKREFVFVDTSNNTYTVLNTITSIGVTSAGELSIQGIVINDVRSLIDFSKLDGFNLENETILNINNTTLTNSQTALTVNNTNAVTNLENAEIKNNITAINNITGTININNSVIEKNDTEPAENNVINSGIINVKNSELKSDIENNGSLNLQGNNAIYYLNNNGDIHTAIKTEFKDTVINNGNLTLENVNIFSKKLTNNNTIITTNSSSDEGVYFDEIENFGTITLDAENNNLNNIVTNVGTIVVNGETNVTSKIEGSGTVTVNNNMTLSENSEFTEEQSLTIAQNGSVTVDGGTLIINTSYKYPQNDIINGTIIGKTGNFQINDSEVFDRQLDIEENSDINVVLSNTILDLTNNGTKETNLGNLVSDIDSSFKLDVDFSTNGCDKLIVHENSNAVINITHLNGLTKKILPVDTYVVFNILNENTNATLYMDEGENGIVQQYTTTIELSDYYNSSTNKYEVTSDDFIGTMGIALDDTKKSILAGNLTGYDILNYVNIQNDIQRVFKVTSNPYVAHKSISITGTGSMEVIGETSNKDAHIIDLGNKFSGFELETPCSLTLKDIILQNATTTNSGIGGALKIIDTNSTIVINNVTFRNNSASIYGGAIYNEGVITELVNTSFYGNYVQNSDSSVNIHGGAIYSSEDLTIKADNGVSTFKNNYIQSADNSQVNEAIYIAKDSATLTLDATNNGLINFEDIINGQNYNIHITGDETGFVRLNNQIINANVDVENVTLNINTDTFNNTNSNLVVNSGILTIKDNLYQNYTIDNLSSSEDVTYLIDFNLYYDENNVLNYNTDTITINNSGSGIVHLSSDIFKGFGFEDKSSELSQYLLENRDCYFVIQILNSLSPSDITLRLEEVIQTYSVESYNYNLKTSDFIGEIGYRVYGTDSIEMGVLSNIDPFIATNNFEYTGGTRTFTFEKDYIIPVTSLDVTGAGRFEIFGNEFTIDFNTKNGFNISAPNKTELVVNNATITNANYAIRILTQNSDVILNNVVLRDNNTALVNEGTVYLNSTYIMEGAETKANNILNNGTLFLNGANTVSSNVSGTGGIYLQSGTANFTNSLITGNTFYLNDGVLDFGENTFGNSSLVINGGKINIGDNVFSEYTFQRLNINSDFKVTIDLNINNGNTDKFIVGTGSTGIITIDNFCSFEMPNFIEYNEIKILYKNNETDTIRLALSDTLKNTPVANFTIDRYFVDNHYIANDTDYICTIMLDINELGDSLVVHAQRTGSVLSIFNQYKYSERIFNIVSDEYVETYNLGKTASGKMIINGNNHILNFDNHSGFEIANKNTTLELNNVYITNAYTKKNGSVIYATNYSGNKINLVDTSFENNVSDGLGGAIYTASNLTISALNTDVIFNNNVANSLLNDIYIDNNKNTNATINLIAQEGHSIEIRGGIDFRKTGLTININDSSSNGQIILAGNLGTSASKLINNFNINGGLLSLIDNSTNNIYVKNLKLNQDIDYNIDIDVLTETSDSFVIPSKTTLPNNRFLLDLDNINMMSFFQEENGSAAVRLITTSQDTTKYFGFKNTDSDIQSYNYNGVDYYFILATEGYLVISRDTPDYFMHPLVRAIRNTVQNTYTMNSDNILYNYGSLVKNPTQNNVQSTKLVIKGNNFNIIASKLKDDDEPLSGIAISGTDRFSAGSQQFLGYDFTFKNFKQAVINNGGKISLSNISFEDNYAHSNGSAIYNASGTLTLSGSTKIRPHLYNNHSDLFGGAIYNSGTITINYTDFGKLPEENTTFGNSALYGGAINNTNNLTVSNSTFVENHAQYSGGAINNTGITKSSSNKFISNNSDGNGGAINTSLTFSDTSSTFESNTAEYGGAIYMALSNNAQMTLSKTLFIGNSAIQGGAIYTAGGKSTLTNVIIGNTDTNYSNEASHGAGIYNAGTMDITSSSFNRNIAQENGGAIFNNGTLQIKKSTFGDKNTTTPNTDLSNIADLGGAIYNSGITNISSALFNANIAKSSGGAIYNIRNITDTSSNYTNNIAETGGAIYNEQTLTLSKVTFSSNSAISGGAIYNTGSLIVNNSTFGNSTKKYTVSNTSESGGVLYNEGNANIVNSNVYYNTADLYGGAIYNDVTDTNSSLTIQTTKLSYNKTLDSNGFGGAIYNNNGLINILGTTLSTNSASRGGAIYNNGTIVINSSGKTATTFSNNTGVFGGAIYNNGVLNIEKGSFTSNSASSSGGALFLNTLSNTPTLTANIQNTTFSKNSSDFGGAIYAIGTKNNNNYVKIEKSIFTSNNAQHDGGAIYADTYSNITIVDTDFKNNTAGSKGGAIFINGGAVVSIFAQSKNVVFSGNRAGGVYNGIYLNSFEDDNGKFFNAILNLQASNGRTINFNDYIAGNGTIHVYGSTIFNKDAVITKGSDITVEHHTGILTIINESNLAGMSLKMNNSTLDMANSHIRTLSLRTLTLSDNNSKVSLDVDMHNATSDKVQTEELIGEGTLTASTVNLVNNSKSPVTIDVGKDSIVNSISTKKAESAEATYKLKSYYDENGLLRVVAYGQKAKPAVLAAPIAAQIGGYLTQINSYDQAFMNMDMNMLKTREERQAETMRNQYALSTAGYSDFNESDNTISYNSKGLWNRPYATFERVNLNNGPKVNNIGYGNYFGGDADMKTLKNGWKRQFSAYIGYNGSVQDYNSQSIDQNGGTVGVTEVWYKNNFFTGLTLNAGANVAQASTDLGRENMPMFMTGIASKSGYNFEFKEGKFIVQPSILLSYSFIHTFSHDNGKGSHVGSSPLNAIQVAPGIKFIANLKNGWQPYLGVNMRWNIIDKTHFSLQDVNIPDMSIDPYVEYGIGLQRRWGERFTGFGQAMIRNGGRNGVMLSFGFKWLVGR